MFPGAQKRRNITAVDEDMSEYLMQDIDKMKPSFYKYKLETDEMEAGNEPKCRPNMHIGLILDETPDYIQDQAFSGVDVYALASLGLAGVKPVPAGDKRTTGAGGNQQQENQRFR